METTRFARLAVVFFVMAFLGSNVLGCATSSQVKDLELKTQKALETAEEALKEAKDARAMIEEMSKYKDDAAASALRAEKAAKDAMESANRAEECEKNCQNIYERITAK